MKRIYGEIKILKKEPLPNFDIYINNENILEWYFLLKGPEETIYEGGYYIGKIILTKEYPHKPPRFRMLTPSGRCLINDDICLSNSNFHSSEWTSAWNIRTMLIGFLSIMLDNKEHGIGHIHYKDEIKEKYKKESIEYNKKKYKDIFNKFKKFVDEEGNIKEKEELSSEPLEEREELSSAPLEEKEEKKELEKIAIKEEKKKKEEKNNKLNRILKLDKKRKNIKEKRNKKI